jgi:hypothetical protein
MPKEYIEVSGLEDINKHARMGWAPVAWRPIRSKKPFAKPEDKGWAAIMAKDLPPVTRTIDPDARPLTPASLAKKRGAKPVAAELSHITMFDDDKSEWPLCDKYNDEFRTVTHPEAANCPKCLDLWSLVPHQHPDTGKDVHFFVPVHVRKELSYFSNQPDRPYSEVWCAKVEGYGWFVAGESVSVTAHLWAEWWEIPPNHAYASMEVMPIWYEALSI